MQHAAVVNSFTLRMSVSVCMCCALQAVAHQDYSKAADVYSFGIVLWELLTWQIPWGDHNPFQVKTLHFAGRSQALGHCFLSKCNLHYHCMFARKLG